MNNKLRVAQIKSGIGRPKSHKQTLRGLGLTRLHKTVILEDTPSIRGMINKVRHLVQLEEIKE